MPRKELIGTVVSNKMQKTVVVAVERHVQHDKYEKEIVKTRKFKAHDAQDSCKIGDRVKIQECPPLSKDKHFQVVAVLAHAGQVGAVQD